MIFFDASAAAERYFQEIGSDRVNELWSGREFFSSLTILHCELTSALNRKRRERASPRGAYYTLKEQIQEGLKKIQAVPVNAELIQQSLSLLDSHPLKRWQPGWRLHSGAVRCMFSVGPEPIMVIPGTMPSAPRGALHARR